MSIRHFTELGALPVPVGDLFGGFSGYDLDVAKDGDRITLAATEVGLNDRMDSAIQASIEVVRRRVDEFGTTEASIQREGWNRILVQVPGVSDIERLKKVIGELGKLEFRLVDPAADVQKIKLKDADL